MCLQGTFKVKIKNYVSTDRPVSLVSCDRRWTKMQGLIPAVLQHMFIQQTIMISIKDFPNTCSSFQNCLHHGVTQQKASDLCLL